jgi:hypothetical protein
MKRKMTESGQALILIVFAAVGLFGFAALAIDGSRVFSDRRHAQNAADTAVLAAALAKIREPGDDAAKFAAAASAAALRAASNGFDAANSIVEVHQCNELNLDPACEGIPSGADLTQYIQVVIRFSTPNTFARIIGRDQVPTVVTAVARAVIGGNTPAGKSAAISAMSPHDEKAVWGNGNFSLNIHNSGIFDNSDHGCAFVTSGASGTYNIDPAYDFEVVGQYCASGGHNVVLSEPPLTGLTGSQLPYPPAINIPPPTISCPGNGTVIWDPVNIGWRISPGTHVYQDLPGGNVIFASGDHCFPAGFKLSGNTPTITVENNSQFLISGGEFQVTSNGNFNCSNLLVHINGGTGMRLNGNGVNNCTGVTFYASTGSVTWNGNSSNTYSAPDSGTYKGLLVYLPYGNSSQLTVSGNASSEFTGSIIAVSSPVELRGNNQTLALSTQIIGYTVQMSGNGTFEIDYDPSQQYGEGDPTMIQVTK